MTTIFDTCTPRPEVLTGELTDQMFAARLKDVVEGRGRPVYQDPETFFRNTFPTDGLKTLAKEVVGRLTGRDSTAAPFIRLETSFGGGKTHNLIALHHLASGYVGDGTGALVPSDWLPLRNVLVAGITGNDLDPMNGVEHGAIRTRTLWGELAYQLGLSGGDPAAAYEVVRASDEGLSAPGTQVLERIVEERPCLIMLDEVARYLKAAEAVPSPTGRGTLAEQTVAFLMALIEFAAGQERVSLVLTLADSSDAFGGQTVALQTALQDMQKVAARQERVLTPAVETEISRIVSHRLFESIRREDAIAVASAYSHLFRDLEGKEVDLPPRAVGSGYREEIISTYPFHPELLSTLNRKTSTIPNFQRTRGALRLLARAVRRLWAERPGDAHLIAIHHLDLADDGIVDDLTSRLQRPQYRAVVESDIASPMKGTVSKARAIDETWTEAGRPPYAKRLATTVFLHSLTQSGLVGVERGDLNLAVLQPGDDPALLDRTLQLMLGEDRSITGAAFWYLHWDGRSYHFKTEPSLEKVVGDEIPSVTMVRTKQEAELRIRRAVQAGSFKPIFFPSDAADLPDDAEAPKLAVIHFDAEALTADQQVPPDLVLRLFNRAGSMQGFRSYKNNVLFLVADRDHRQRMMDVVRRYLAIQRINEDGDRLRSFSDEQRKRLRSMLNDAELEVRISIARAYRYLFYPSADAPAASEGLQREMLPVQEQGNVEELGQAVLRTLRGLEKALTGDDKPLAPQFVKARAWPRGGDRMSTEDLRKEFARRLNLRIVLDVNQLKKTIQQGCASGVWVYSRAGAEEAYGRASPAPLVEFSEDALLYEEAAARALGLRIRGEEAPPPPPPDEPCPLCGQNPCVCGEEEGPDGPEALRFSLQGAVGQVFQDIRNRFHDAGHGTLARLSLTLEGVGAEVAKDARSLGLAIPQLPRQGELVVKQTFGAAFPGPDGSESLEVEYSGSWERYRRIKDLTDALANEATELSVRLAAQWRFPEGLLVSSPEFEKFQEVLGGFGFGRITADVEGADVPEA